MLTNVANEMYTKQDRKINLAALEILNSIGEEENWMREIINITKQKNYIT